VDLDQIFEGGNVLGLENFDSEHLMRLVGNETVEQEKLREVTSISKPDKTILKATKVIKFVGHYL
jgi:hypothetical protein